MVNTMIIPRSLFVLLIVSLLTACSGRIASGVAQACSDELDAAEVELNKAKADGLGEALTITKAASLITAAAFQKQIERYQSCLDKAHRARAYIEDARRH